MTHDLVVIGGSLGSIDVLKTICAALPPDLPAAVVVVVHVGAKGNDLIADLLDRAGPLPAITAADGMAIEPGHIYVAAADAHLIVAGQILRLGRGPRENMSRPAIDPLFRSAALYGGPRVIGVVLSGLLNDGASGLAAIRQCGGLTLVQSPSDAEADDMPLGALAACDVDYRGFASELGPMIAELTLSPAGAPQPTPRGLKLEIDIALGRPCDTPIIAGIADPVALSCPACGGVLSVMKARDPLRFRCQVGHGYTADALETEQVGSTDEALRVALRIIEERATLATRMADDNRAKGRHAGAELLERRIVELRDHAEVIRKTLLREA